MNLEEAEQAKLLREIALPPVRVITIDPSCLLWNDRAVAKLAETIYQEQSFDRLPILSDALEDAGCVDGELLAHCRSAGPHVRGCWAIDLILSKDR